MVKPFSGRFVLKQVNARVPGRRGVPFFIHNANDRYISERIRTKGAWEPFESAILCSLLSPGEQVLDVGANIGWHTVQAALRVGPAGGVFAFEPDEENFSLLSANINVNRLTWVHAKRAALGRASGVATLTRSADNMGDHRVKSTEAESDPATGALSVKVIALDEYIDDHPQFDRERLRVVKIDVQGFEAEVLLGAARLLASLSKRTIVFLEFDPSLLNEQGSDACTALLDIIAQLERVIFAIRRPIRHLQRVSIEDLRASARSQHSPSTDLILVSPDRVAELRSAVPWLSRMITQWR
jgi:FkbM family methyltransferase